MVQDVDGSMTCDGAKEVFLKKAGADACFLQAPGEPLKCRSFSFSCSVSGYWVGFLRTPLSHIALF